MLLEGKIIPYTVADTRESVKLKDEILSKR